MINISIYSTVRKSVVTNRGAFDRLLLFGPLLSQVPQNSPLHKFVRSHSDNTLISMDHYSDYTVKIGN